MLAICQRWMVLRGLHAETPKEIANAAAHAGCLVWTIASQCHSNVSHFCNGKRGDDSFIGQYTELIIPFLYCHLAYNQNATRVDSRMWKENAVPIENTSWFLVIILQTAPLSGANIGVGQHIIGEGRCRSIKTVNFMAQCNIIIVGHYFERWMNASAHDNNRYQ